MNPLLALKGASLTVRLVVYGLLLALLAGALWWAVGAPRVALASARAELATLQGQHDALKTRLAEAEAASADKTKAVQTAYDAGVKASAAMREREISDAFQRGKAAAAGISAGTVRVRTVWRDRDCPATAEGAGAGAGEGAAGVSGSRADAIGSLLAAGGSWDAQYAEAYRRLESAQAIVDACYEEPVHAAR